MTTVIAFNGGAYGTYLNWALDSLTNNCELISPLTANSNNHGYRKNHLGNIQGWHNYLLDSHDSLFVRLHPKTQINESLSQNLETILERAEFVIHLYPDHNSVLLAVNNYYSKVWNDWWGNQYMSDEERNKIYTNWPVNHDVPFDQIPRWILREYLSLYLMPAWFDQIEWYHPEKWKHDRAIVIHIKELLYDFEATMEHIRKVCGYQYIRPTSDMLPIHNQMIQAQKNLTQDWLCNQIVDSVTNERYFDWTNHWLSLPSEAWIQWQLRNRGWELECDSLDIFPTNSVKLRSLMQNTHDKSI